MTSPRTTVAVLAAAGLLALASTGGAVAGSMITGAQIKNDTVTTKDIKNATISTSDLAPGVAGALAGPTGPAGAAGAPGAAGVSGLQTVTVTSATVAPGTTVNLTAICPAGKKVLGGTASWDNGFPGIISPLLADRWNVGGKNPGTNNGALYGSVVCATTP